MRDVLYNLLVVAVDVAALLLLWRGRTPRVALRGFSLVGLASLFFALLFGGGAFGALRLLSYGVFLHCPATLVAAAILLRERRAVALGAGLVAVGLSAVGFDAFFVEPTALEITHLRIESDLLSRPVRLVVIADIQMDHVGDYELRALRAAAQEKPDLVLWPGDFTQEADPARRGELLAALSADLHASGLDGVRMVAVGGNNDEADWPTLFSGLDATSFVQTSSVDIGELRVTGLSLEDSFDSRLHVEHAGRFQIVMGHAPDFALGDVPAELLVAGHTHGGQVRLPLVGPLMTLSEVPRAWAAGATKLDGERWLVVSRGVGMERGPAPQMRFLCRPEVVVIDLVPRQAPSPAR